MNRASTLSSITPCNTSPNTPINLSFLLYNLSIQDVCWIDHEFVFYDDNTHKKPAYLKISNFGGREVDFRKGSNIRSGFMLTPQTEWKPRAVNASLPRNVSYDSDKAYLFVESSYSDNFGTSNLLF